MVFVLNGEIRVGIDKLPLQVFDRSAVATYDVHVGMFVSISSIYNEVGESINNLHPGFDWKPLALEARHREEVVSVDLFDRDVRDLVAIISDAG